MNPINPEAPLTNADRERLYIIKRAVAAGTFHINADDAVTKTILSMSSRCLKQLVLFRNRSGGSTVGPEVWLISGIMVPG
jgi:hypothetical protein